MNKIEKALDKLIKDKREEIQINKIRHTKWKKDLKKSPKIDE